MSLAAGDRLGAYEIVALLGAGGMGEVYRARDTRLKREVAIKILPQAFANDADRLARFQREAELLASLNHPSIACVFGLEQTGGHNAIVLELVEGDTLADRIARGPLPLDEALPIAKQIAEALEAAHERGVIHRDLKPDNVKVRPDGTVKVLDFGLAKAMEPAGSAPNVSQSPTVTTPAMTQAGIILGTAAYMSPEQARGQIVGKQADIWAFGCVLYEMLTGTRAFGGEDATEIIAAVVKIEPNWAALQPDTPPAIRTLIKRCLEKDRKARIGDASTLRYVLSDVAGETTTVSAATSHARSAGSWPALPWVVAAALGVGLVLVVALREPWQKVPPAPLSLSVELGADASFSNPGTGAATILSPDGAVVAFVAQKGGGGSRQLYVRRLNQLQATPLSGTDDAESPFFSPDGQWIAFFADGKLKKISVTGGAAVTLCDAPNGRGGAWGEDGTIVFSPDASPGVSLLRVSSAGGKPEPLTSLAEGEVTQRWPQVLPGGKAVLFTSNSHTGNAFDDANLVVQPLPTGARKVVQRGGYYGRYLPSGHLVYIHDGTLFAAPFDLDRLEVTGQPVPALEGVASNAVSGGAQFAVSASGTLVYLPGQSAGSGRPIHWMDHEGKTTLLRATPSNWFNLHFTPDGRRLAMQINEGRIWVYEWARDTLTRLTFDTASSENPVWTPDGRRIVFGSSPAGTSMPNLYWQRADGTGDAQRLTESKNAQLPASWHPSGKFLAFEEQNPQTNFDLMILPMEGDEASGWKPGNPRCS